MAEKPKRVTQRIVRGEDGRIKILYIDLDTLQYVDDPFSQGYKVVTANTPIENVINIDEEDPQPNPENPVVTDPAEEAAIKESVQSAEGMRGSNSPTYSGSQSTGGSGYTAPSAPSQQGSSSGSERTAGVSGLSQSNTSSQRSGSGMATLTGGVTPRGATQEVAGSINKGLDNLHPDYRDRFAGFMDEATKKGLNLDVASTYRSPAEQQSLFDQGRKTPGSIVTNARPGTSAHNYALAVDVVPSGLQQQPNWAPDDPRWQEMGALAQNQGLNWGGSWKSFKDMPHVQAPEISPSSLIGRPVDATGFVQLTPQESLSVRGNYVPTPSPSGTEPSYENMREATGAPVGDLQGLAASAIDSMGNQRAGTAANTSLDAASGTDMTANPGALASLGYTPRTEQDMADIGFALAGELGPYGLKTLGDENSISKKELANMIATIENRAAATGKSIKDVLSPSQYNSLMEKNLGVTRANFTKYGDDIMAAVKDFYSPASFNNPVNATHYANLSISNPGWAAGLLGDQKVGSHTFGRLSDEYSPSNTYSDVRTNFGLASYARDQINNQTSKGGYQPSLDRFSDMTDAVSRSNGESQGGRGRGGYSASSAEGSRSGSGSSGVSSRSEGGGLRSDNGGFSSGSSGYGPDMGRFDGVQGAVEASNSSGKSGSSDKGTSSYGGAKSSGDAQSSGKSGGKSSGGGFSSGRTSGKTDDN